jgi:signal transduction histidine kinase
MEELLLIKPPPIAFGSSASTIYAAVFLYTISIIMLVLLIVFTYRIIKLKREVKENKHAMVNKEKEISELSRELDKRTGSIEKALEKAEDANRLKSLFLANMSHEIRTPLNGIVGFSELIAEKDTDPQARILYAKQISWNSEQLLKLIDQIFHLAIIETGKATIEKEKFKIFDVITEIRDIVEEKINISKKNIQFSFNIEDENFIVSTDKNKLKLILMNLFDNALKFTNKGLIEFTCLRLDNNYLFQVSDSGCGLKEDEYEMIFDPFTQGADVIKKIKGGSGLGLSNVKNYVVLLGGKIWCTRNKPNGSIFSFTIPAPDINKKELYRFLQNLSKN